MTAAGAPSGGQVLLVAGFDGLFRSDDGGGRWSEIQTQADNVVGLDVATTRTMPAIVNTYVKGAYRTNDGGATWVERNVILGVRQSNEFTPVARLGSLQYSPNCTADGTIFSASAFVLLKSTDRNVVGGNRSGRLSDFDISTVHHRGLAGLCPGPDGLRRSRGKATSTGPPGQRSRGRCSRTWVRLFGRSCSARSSLPIRWCTPARRAGSSRVTMRSHLAAHGPAGTSMLAISSDHSGDGTVFAGTNSGVYVTVTEVRPGPDSSPRRCRPRRTSRRWRSHRTTAPTTVWWRARKGLYRSTDGGTTFATVGTSLIQDNHLIADYQNPVSAPLQFSPTCRDRTIFGTAQDDIVRSTDGGDSWQVLSLPPAAEPSGHR